MVFRRRPVRTWSHARHILWPRGGWLRATRYLFHRLLRLSSSTNSIAGGLAWGVAVSVTPFLGFHLILALGLARVCRHNVLAALAGTVVGNPWTFPLIWWMLHTMASLFTPENAPLPQVEAQDLSIAIAAKYFWKLFVPVALASIPLAILSWVVVFFSARRIIPLLRRRKSIP